MAALETRLQESIESVVAAVESSEQRQESYNSRMQSELAESRDAVLQRLVHVELRAASISAIGALLPRILYSLYR
eukprot:SAG11_NODE_225_length_12064_cov_7.850815_19_plen_75_part_00